MPETAAAIALQESLWSCLSERLATQMGLHYPKERWRDLKRGVAAAAPEFGMASADACARWLLSAPLTRPQVEVLARHLTVGETYFFREKKTFEILEAQLLPALLRERTGTQQRLRIWSAGCCTGEEPYSIAILLARMIPNL
ncbi:MAG: CheR family methyltransferase, partial [Polaromonas sp.]